MCETCKEMLSEGVPAAERRSGDAVNSARPMVDVTKFTRRAYGTRSTIVTYTLACGHVTSRTYLVRNATPLTRCFCEACEAAVPR